VRLVYCLGYGEDGACSPLPSTRNSGTPDFWEIFERIAVTGARHGNDPLPSNGLVRKLAILDRLQERGIWLEDASPIGFYQAGKGRLTTDTSILTAIEREGYSGYVWPGVAADEPQEVWVIGRTVGRNLRGLPGIRHDRCIMQPSYARRAQVWDDYEDELSHLAQALAACAP
jgi:hypothetical protein